MSDLEFRDLFDEFRRELAEPVPRTEEDLAERLRVVAAWMDDDLGPLHDSALLADDPLEAGTALLAGVDSWSSLATHLVRRFYVAGPDDGGVAALREPGAAKEVTRELRVLAARMRRHVGVVCQLIGAPGFTITAGVPVGLQLALQWTATAALTP